MEKGIFERLDVVKEYGNEKQIAHFEKYLKWKSKNVETSFHKTLDEIFVEWGLVKQGRKSMYELGEKNLERKERVDARVNNGQGQLPYKEDIREAILAHLEETNRLTTTYRHLLRELKIVDDVLHIASRKFAFDERKTFYDNLDDKYKIYGYHMFWEVVDIEHRRLTDNLKSVLQDMAKHKIIRLMDVMNAVYVDEAGREVHEPLHVIDAKRIDDKKRELREKYNVTHTELMFKPKVKKEIIKAYMEDERDYLQSMGIEYVYDALHVNIIATNREMENYASKVLSKEIKQKHLQHAYELAIKRQENFSSQLLNLLGGKTKPKHVLDNPTSQELIEFEKQDGTYAKGYEGALKVINNIDEAI